MDVFRATVKDGKLTVFRCGEIWFSSDASQEGGFTLSFMGRDLSFCQFKVFSDFVLILIYSAGDILFLKRIRLEN